MKKLQDANNTSGIRRATVHDVAQRAEVSIATVSRALNTPQMVRPEVRDRIFKAAAELDYTANSIGKALRRRRTQIIGTLVPALNDPLFSEVANGVQQALAQDGYVGFLQTSGFDNRRLFEQAKHMIDGGAEGLLVFGRIDDQRLLDHAAQRGFPLLSIYSYDRTSTVPAVGIDNARATQQLIDVLRELGHRQIAMISGDTDGNDRQAARAAAYGERMTELGSPIALEVLKTGDELSGSVAALHRLLEHHDETTAIICNRDNIAFAVLSECRRLGIEVPEKLSVTGFDDLSFAPLLDPSLTAVSVPAEQIGRLAAKAMMSFLENGEPLTSVCLDTEVVVRGSTARPRRSRRLRPGPPP
ncbi:MAG: substrate-binding domain-containing protein [Hyphomicrobiales bacterium]